MRDVDGSIAFFERHVTRTIAPGSSAKPFLESDAGEKLVADHKLVSYAFIAPDTAISPRLPFVSYPFEWCDTQLHLAGQLTLDISREILDSGHELKDASAWNVIFRGNQPLFCDHLSFQPAETPQWWAFGQFVRHFLLPLAVSQRCGFKPHHCFSTYRDGLPPQAARAMFGPTRFLSRYWPLMLGSESAAKAKPARRSQASTMHANLYAFCQSMLDSARPRRAQASHWQRYTQERPHYTTQASSEKRNKVAAWLQNTGPDWVVDLGCNSGEFSLLAADAGADVIAIDLDHDAIENVVLTHHASTAIHPLVCNLGDMAGGRGWCGDEFPSLMTRLHQHADTLLMLALLHHLAISEAIALPKIAQMAAHITRRYLIIEWIDPIDPMVQLLCAQRRRDPMEFSVAAQQAAFARYFDTMERFPIPNTHRTLCLLKKTTA